MSYDYPSTATGKALVTAADAAAARDAVGLPVVDTISALKSSAPTTSKQVRVLGYYAAGDGGGGVFRWDSSDTTSVDNGGTILTSSLSSAGRWRRVYEGEVNARWFGMSTTLADNTAQLQAAVDWVSSQESVKVTSGGNTVGGTVYIPEGYYRTKLKGGTTGLNTITINQDNVTIRGAGAGTILTMRGNDGTGNQADTLFTFKKASGRGKWGGVRDIWIDGASQLKWCITLSTWHGAIFEKIIVTDVHGGVLDAVADTTDGSFGEHITVKNIDYIPSSGTNSCITQYGVRFRALTSVWTDCWISDCMLIGVWDSSILLDGCYRFDVRNIAGGGSIVSSNSIDGTQYSGIKYTVKVTNTVVIDATARSGQHVISSIYHENHVNTDVNTNCAVFIETPAGQTGYNGSNQIRDINTSWESGTAPALLRLVNNSGIDGLTNRNVFTNNRRSLSANRILIGPQVRDTVLNVFPSSASNANLRLSDQGTNTIINNVISGAFRNSAAWPDNKWGTGQVDVGQFIRDSTTGRLIMQDAYNNSVLIGPLPGLDVVAPYGPQRIQAMPTPVAPTVVPSVTGSTSWTYYVVAKDKDGNKSIPSAATTITNGPATLANGTYNLIQWFPVAGAVKYDLLRGNTSSAVATDLVTPHFYDGLGASQIVPSAYAASGSNPSGTLTVDGVLTASSTIELGNASDTTLARSSAGVVTVEGIELVRRTITSITGSTNISTTTGDQIVLIDTGGLPTLGTAMGAKCKITLKNRTSAGVTIATTSNQTIEGVSDFVLPAGQAIDIVADSTNNWSII